MPRYQPWSNEEIERLKKLYPKLWVKDLAKEFPGRTKGTIVVKALSLGLPSAKLWQPEEDNLLIKYFKDSSPERLQKLLPNRSWSAILARGERLKLKRKTNKPRKSVNENYFKTWSPNMAYLLGFTLADGCITRGTYKGYSDSLKFGVQSKDIDILKKIKKELESDHKISMLKNAAHLSIASREIVNDLKTLKISYRKSLKEEIPDIPSLLVRHFIRGIVDGDGSIWFEKKTNYPTLSIVGGKNTLRFVGAYFWNNFGAFSKLSNHANGLYQISYRASTAKDLILYLYKDAELFLDRKYKLAQKCLGVTIRKNKHYGSNSGRESYQIKNYI